MISLEKHNFEIVFKCSTNEERRILLEPLTVKNPNAHFIRSYVGNGGHWDGYNRFYTKDRFSYGLLSLVLTNLHNQKIEYQYDYVQIPKIKITEKDLTTSLRPQQKQAVLAFFGKEFGIIKLPPRGGKTFIASECIRLYKLHLKDKAGKIMFITDSSDIFTQAVKDISKFLGLNEDEVGIIKGTDLDFTKSISVAMMQTINSLIKHKNTKFKAFIGKLDFLIVDEIHEFGAENRLNILTSFRQNCDFFLSLSATPKKSENASATLNIKGLTGDVIYEVTEEEMRDAGLLSTGKVLIILFERHSKIGNISDKASKYLQALETVIHNNYNRNLLISKVLNVCRKLQLKTLVLLNSKVHGNYLSKLVNEPFISGDDENEIREYHKNKFLKGKGKILLASDIYKKGITLPEVEIMFNVNGGKEQSLIVQRRGRTLGITKDKSCSVTIDIFDYKNKYFSTHSASRLQAYESEAGEQNIIILNEGQSGFYTELEGTLKNIFQ